MFEGSELCLQGASYLETLNALQALFTDDPAPVKANLMIGVYRDDRGNPFLLDSVKIVSLKLHVWNHVVWHLVLFVRLN